MRQSKSYPTDTHHMVSSSMLLSFLPCFYYIFPHFLGGAPCQVEDDRPMLGMRYFEKASVISYQLTAFAIVIAQMRLD